MDRSQAAILRSRGVLEQIIQKAENLDLKDLTVIQFFSFFVKAFIESDGTLALENRTADANLIALAMKTPAIRERYQDITRRAVQSTARAMKTLCVGSFDADSTAEIICALVMGLEMYEAIIDRGGSERLCDALESLVAGS